MAKNKKFTVKYKRKAEKKTDYKARLKLLTSKKPRLVIRKKLKNFTIALIIYGEKGDKTLASAHSRELIKYGWTLSRGNMPSAYLTGYLCGLKCKKINVKEAIVDFGLQENIHGSNLFAAIKGAIDAGLTIPHKAETMPAEERIQGKHIEEYKKNNIIKKFEETKKEITKKWQ